MNVSSLIGVVLGVGVLWASLQSTTDDFAFFLDPHGILIVVGGTAAAASLSFPIGEVLGLIKVFILRVLGRQKADYPAMIAQILELQKKAAHGSSALNEALPSIRHEFLREAVALVASGILSEAELRQTLEQRLATVEARLLHEAHLFRSIGRFPPAFGLLATTLGMIGLLQKLGQPDSQKLIGPAMSVGLIGTLYGIALSNLVFLPIAENLSLRTREEMTLRRLILEGAMLLKAQANPVTLREGLNSFLLPQERVVRKGPQAASPSAESAA